MRHAAAGVTCPGLASHLLDHTTSCAGGRHNMLRPLQVDLSFDLESGVRVTSDMGYLCANFSLCRLRDDVTYIHS